MTAITGPKLPPVNPGGPPRGADGPPPVAPTPVEPAMPVATFLGAPLDPVVAPPLLALPPDEYGQADLPPETNRAVLRGEGNSFERPVMELVPDLRRVRDLPEVRDRFTSDYALIKNQLTELPHLEDTDRATRAYEFFSAYAERFVVLANGQAQGNKQGRNDGEGGIVPPPLPGELDGETTLPPGFPDDGGLLAKGQPQLDGGKTTGPADGPLPPDGEGPLDPETTLPGQNPDGTVARGEGDPAVDGEGALPEDAEGEDVPTRGRKGPGGADRPRSRLEALEAQLQAEELDGEEPGSRQQQGAAGKDRSRAGGGLWAETAMRSPEELDEGPLRFFSPGEVQEEVRSFARKLKEMAFDQLKDAHTGKDGVQTALELLKAKSAEEVRARAQETLLLPKSGQWPPKPPNEEERQRQAQEKEQRQVPEQLMQRQDFKPAARGRELGDSPGLDPRFAGERAGAESLAIRNPGGGPDPTRVQLHTAQAHDQGPLEGEERSFKKRLTDGKLGPNMLWNTLHKFRGDGADSVLEKDKTDKLMVVAIGLLVFAMGVVAVLIAL